MRIGILTIANSWHVPVKTKYLVSRGHEVFYLQVHPGTNQPIIPKGVTCIDIKSSLPSFLRLADNLYQSYKYSRKLNLDILHIIDMKYSFYSYFIKAKVKIIENNGSDVLVVPKQHKWVKYIYKILYKGIDGVVQDSTVTQSAGISFGAPQDHNEVVELGIDFNVFNDSVEKGVARKRHSLENEKIVFSPRGFHEIYNIETIIRSIPYVKQKFPDVRYLFCRHSGKLEAEFQQLIDTLGVNQNIVFTGFLDNETELPFYYADSDIVVSVPSSDSSPRSVYEALACMKPVIISELPWYHKKFKKDQNIFVVPLKDEVALSQMIIDYFDEKISIDVKSACDFVMENINMVASSKKMEKFYSELLAARI